MAIIKTLRRQAFLLLALLGAVQSMDIYPKPTFVASFVSPPNTHVPKVEGADCSKEITMTCTKNAHPGMTPHLAFQTDGADIDSDSWIDVTSEPGITDQLAKDASSYGIHTCVSGDGGFLVNFPTKADNKVEMKCTGCSKNDTCTDNPAIGKYSHCKDGKCACMYGGDLGSCKVCDVSTNKGCGDTPYTVRCDEGTCKECEFGTNKGCKAPTPVCLREMKKLKCYPKKSSAATVTSTACIVIASIVVALMN